MAAELSTNLTLDLGHFVGRVRDLEALHAAFARGAPLVTVLGPGGVGKTRLAREFGRRVAARAGAADGVWFCDLTDARAAADIAAAIARALDLGPDAASLDDGAGESRLGRALRHRGRVVLILDNLEHIGAAAGETLARLLGEAPATHVLATSRVPLELACEARHELEPLAVDEGVALFVHRAQMVRPGWDPSADERAAVAAIVRRLDALPLAIELAAARSGVLAPADLLARLAASTDDVLRSARRHAPARHATLRAAIAWSWELLGPVERRALARCAVFQGGFDLPAAEAVLGDGDPSARGAPAVLDLVQALRDNSLVRAYEPAETPGVLRLGLWETIREFAAARLAADGPAARADAEACHAAHFLARGREILRDRAWQRAWRRVALEADNLAAAFARARDAGRAAVALELALALDQLLALRGPDAQRVATLSAALELARDAGAELAGLRSRALAARADALRRRGELEAALRDAEAAAALARDEPAAAVEALGAQARAWFIMGRHDTARALAEAQREKARALGDRAAEAHAHYVLGMVATYAGQVAASRVAYQRAAALYDAIGDVRGAAVNRQHVASCEYGEGRLDAARAALEGLIRETEASGEHAALSEQLVALACVCIEEQRLDEGVARCERAVGLQRALGSRYGEAQALLHLGMCHDEAGRRDEARASYHAALEIYQAAGARQMIVVLLSLLGRCDADEDRLDAARARFDAADAQLRAVRDPTGIEAVRLFRGHLELALARRAAAEGDAARAAAHRDAVRELLAWAHAPPASGTAVGAPTTRSDKTRVAVRRLERAAGHDAAATTAPPAPDRAPRARDAVAVARDGEWFACGAAPRVDLSRRYAVRRVLLALVAQRLSAPGDGVAWPALLAAGWPGQRTVGTAGERRVRTAIWTLRRAGLAEVIQTREEGYALDPAREVRWADE